MGSKLGFEYAGRPFSLEDYANRPLNLFLSPKPYAQLVKKSNTNIKSGLGRIVSAFSSLFSASSFHGEWVFRTNNPEERSDDYLPLWFGPVYDLYVPKSYMTFFSDAPIDPSDFGSEDDWLVFGGVRLEMLESNVPVLDRPVHDRGWFYNVLNPRKNRPYEKNGGYVLVPGQDDSFRIFPFPLARTRRFVFKINPDETIKAQGYYGTFFMDN